MIRALSGAKLDQIKVKRKPPRLGFGLENLATRVGG
jgi:hypothetical protein